MTFTPAVEAATAARQRILIVEDEAVIAMDMAQHLRDFGYEVVGVAASGDRARQLAEEHRPDLIMMDVVIRGPQDGIETACAIRATTDVPVVFLTAYGDAQTLERAKLASPHGYLLKPFRPNDLRTTIEVALNKQRLEQRVRESEHWLTRTLQCIGDGVIATDPLGAIRFMNSIAEALTSCPMEAARGRRTADVFTLHAESGDEPLPDLLQAALQRRERTAPCRGLVHTPSGQQRLFVDVGAAPILDGDGRLLGGVLVLRDVTQRRLDEQELQRYRDHLESLVRERTRQLEAAKLEAERSNQARMDFMSSISHELRTPLNAVLGFSQLLEMEPLAPRLQHYNRHVIEAGRHLLHLIDDLLDLAKIDAGRLTVQCRRVDVQAAVAEAMPLVESLAAARQVALAAQPPDAPLAVLADATRLKQVLVNLLSNAVKYNHVGGSVRLSWQPLGDARVRIAVADTGPGIEPGKLARLFRTFERLDAEGSGVAGSGIGLAFSKRLAELMGGELGVHSEIGAGSTFWIDLPLADDTA